jgi:hypothetical protein
LWSDKKRPVDQLYIDATVLHRLDGIGDLDQLAGGFFRVGVRAINGEFHQAISIWAAAFAVPAIQSDRKTADPMPTSVTHTN